MHKNYKCLHPSGRIYIASYVLFNVSSYENQSSDFQYNLLELYIIPISNSNQDTLEADATDNDHHSPQYSFHNKLVVSSPLDTLPTDSLHCSSPTQPVPDINSPTQLNIHSTSSSLPNQQNLPSLPVQTQHPLPLTQYKPLISTHKMITRAKAGIFKPKAFITNYYSLEPSTTSEALFDPKWKAAIYEEYDTLIKNNT